MIYFQHYSQVFAAAGEKKSLTEKLSLSKEVFYPVRERPDKSELCNGHTARLSDGNASNDWSTRQKVKKTKIQKVQAVITKDGHKAQLSDSNAPLIG